MKRERNQQYLNWVAQEDHECVMCGETGWDANQIIAHHAISIPGMALGGMGTKASDYLAMPMHVLCHQEFHTHFDKWKEAQPIWLTKFHWKVIRTVCEQTPTDLWTLDLFRK